MLLWKGISDPMTLEKRSGPTSPSGAGDDVGSIFLLDETGVRIIIRPHLVPDPSKPAVEKHPVHGGYTAQGMMLMPDDATADKILKLLNKTPTP